MPVLSAVNFGTLVGAQISALIEAEARGAEKTSEYIDNVGFERQADGKQKLRVVAFDMRRRDNDGVVRTHTISIPVLTLVPIPLLSVEEATIDFDLLVERQSVREEAEADGSSDGGGTSLGGAFRPALPLRRIDLLTRLARKSRGETESTSDLKMHVRIGRSPFPAGIEQLLDTANLSTTDETNE